jgi:hypothetical protein
MSSPSLELITIGPAVSLISPLPVDSRAFGMLESSRRTAGLVGEEIPRATDRAVTDIVAEPRLQRPSPQARVVAGSRGRSWSMSAPRAWSTTGSSRTRSSGLGLARRIGPGSSGTRPESRALLTRNDTSPGTRGRRRSIRTQPILDHGDQATERLGIETGGRRRPGGNWGRSVRAPEGWQRWQAWDWEGW